MIFIRAEDFLCKLTFPNCSPNCVLDSVIVKCISHDKNLLVWIKFNIFFDVAGAWCSGLLQEETVVKAMKHLDTLPAGHRFDSLPSRE